jgi:hypothetical protein
MTRQIKDTTGYLGDWHFNSLIVFFMWESIISAVMIVLSLLRKGEKEENDNKKEWTLGKILFRIFGYPISITIMALFIIYAFVFLFHGPFSSFNGGYFFGMFIVFLGAAFYLFSDILILTRTGKKEDRQEEVKTDEDETNKKEI